MTNKERIKSDNWLGLFSFIIPAAASQNYRPDDLINRLNKQRNYILTMILI